MIMSSGMGTLLRSRGQASETRRLTRSELMNGEADVIVNLLRQEPHQLREIRRYLCLVHGSETSASITRQQLDLLIEEGAVKYVDGKYQTVK